MKFGHASKHFVSTIYYEFNSFLSSKYLDYMQFMLIKLLHKVILRRLRAGAVLRLYSDYF